VHVVVEEVLGVRQQSAGEHRRRRRPVTDRLLLVLGDLDDHLRGRVFDVHLVEDGRAVVRHHHVPTPVDEHLVHPPGSERRPDRLRDGPPGADVRLLGVAAPRPLAALREDVRRLSKSRCHDSRPSRRLRFYKNISNI
jgi:hypothetical protein